MNQKIVNAIRFLGVDAINKANSGHPGIVLGAAPMVYQLFSEHMNIHVTKKDWFNRDRFVLSAGHGSMLLYAINHLVGYNVSLDDIKNFRQIGNTPGHPEFGHTDGVETTSGPLGQGLSNAVGMAMAESHLAARFNKQGFNIVDHYTYVICGDGDLQEGVAMEAMSLAGHLGLHKLVVLFDSNDIQLDGEVSLAYSENHRQRFQSIGWNYLLVEDGNDLLAINQAINLAKNQTEKPSIIEIKTVIGYGSHDAGTSKVHGSPLGFENTETLREKLEWKHNPFEIPNDVYEAFRHKVQSRGKKAYRKWNQLVKEYQEAYPKDADLLNQFVSNKTIFPMSELIQALDSKADATRNMSGKIIHHLSSVNLNLIGGSADLTSSTKAKGLDGHFSQKHRLGRNINFGVREHAMAAIANGMMLHGGLKVFVGGFFVFSDYMKPSIRLSALMSIPTIYVFTHDSIAVGEDGPTHQPVEQLAGLRAIPNLNVIRPADANETIAAWKIAIESTKTPTVIVLTRQNITNQTTTSIDQVAQGAYIVSKEKERLDGIIITSGSEMDLVMKAKDLLEQKGKNIRIVSMPSASMFERMTKKYQNQILPKSMRNKTVAIEMASPQSWYKYTPNVYGIESFGLSAPAHVVMEHFGFTPEQFATYCMKKF